MATKFKVVMVLVMVATVWVVFRPRGGEPELPGSESAAAVTASSDRSPPAQSTGEISATRVPTASPSGPAAAAAGAAPRAVPPPENTVLVRGRCVDADSGAPLAGCSVRVTARQFRGAAVGGARMEAELEDHLVEVGLTDWRDPEAVVTGPDGRFVLEFPAPPPVKVELALEHAERIPLHGVWSRLPGGACKDMGDVPMERGVTVAGRVLDAEGREQPGVSVRLFRLGPAEPWLRAPCTFRVSSDANGRFRFPASVPPGVWRVRAHGRYLASPAETTISAATAACNLEVVVRSLPAITGIVVDDTRAPVAGAWVDFHPHGMGTRFFANQTGPDGTFRLERRPQDARDPVALTVAAGGHEVVWRQGSYPWGSSGIVIVLPRGVDVPVRVVDADTGEPVERFAVRCFSTGRHQASVHLAHRRLRHPGRHPNGELVIGGVCRGPNVLMVQPMDGEHLPSTWQRFDVGAAGASASVIRVARPVARILELSRGDGQPVAGAQVQLVRPADGAREIALDSEVGKAGRLGKVPHDQLSLLLQEGVTDAAGRFTLRGPPGERLALRLPGPCHVPRVVNDVVLERGAAPLNIEVSAGATISGQIRPATLLGHWQQRPGICLLSPRTRGTSSSRARLEAEIGEDGSFAFESVSPGTWEVCFACSLVDRHTALPIQRRVNLPVGSVRDLKLGESRRLDLDLRHLVPGRVEGTVFLNDRPLGNEVVTLVAAPLDIPGQARTWRAPSCTVRTGPRGRFVLNCFPGNYRMQVRLGEATNALLCRDHLESEDLITVFPGARIVRDVHLRGGALQVQVVASDGRTPVEGVQVAWRAQNGGDLRFTDPTDRDGRFTIDPVPLTTLVFKTWPASLRAPADRNAFVRRTPDTWRQVLVEIGSVTLSRARREHTHRLVLPAAAGY